ncbi:hypothetical protein NVP1151O_54 [Vibrio phage 1.151.O._10N.222.46.B1]|nr:hypothetical protein NVP1151O_54 [Vibrio phage 1.151.O._10N.222.46.B1]
MHQVNAMLKATIGHQTPGKYYEHRSINQQCTKRGAWNDNRNGLF